ncbi:MAG: transposase [Alphaproteobacteria bacterium]|nr:transposase [Alphaproteobacteria bacterium]
MGVQNELHLESLSRMEVLSGPTGRRRWPDEVKCQLVAESLITGVTVRKVAERYGISPNHLSTWRGLAKRGELLDPSLAGSSPDLPTFANIVLDEPIALPLQKKIKPLGHIELETGGVTLRLDLDTDVHRIADLVFALKVTS